LVGDWVLLAPIPDRAVRVYALLRAHVNHARKDNEAWPSQEKLAAALGLSKPDDIGKSIKILEGIGAVRKKYRTGRKGRYAVYVVRLHAPAGYTGLRSAADDLHRPGAIEQLVEERVKRLPHRTHAAIAAASTGNTPDLGSPVRTTPDLGATPDRGVGNTPNQGWEPYKGEPDEGAFKTHTALPRGEVCDPEPPVIEFPDEIAATDPDDAAAEWGTRPRAARRSATRWNATTHSPAARQLMDVYVKDHRVPADTMKRLLPVVTKLLKEDIPGDVILQAIPKCFAENCGPVLLPDFVAKVMHQRDSSLEPELGTTGRRLQAAERLREEMRAADAAEAAGRIKNTTPRAITG
jgi:hypothetical protein